MKRVIRFVIPLAMLIVGLLSFSACGGIAGGAQIRLEGLNLGAVTMEGKPINGLPSDKINLLLDVSAETVRVKSNAGVTVLSLEPSGGTIEISTGGVSIKGVKSEQIKVEWSSNQ
jgi:hypothetical protein